jgi:hypothetical protein
MTTSPPWNDILIDYAIKNDLVVVQNARAIIELVSADFSEAAGRAVKYFEPWGGKTVNQEEALQSLKRFVRD